MSFKKKIGILDPEGKEVNPLNGAPYSDHYKKTSKAWSTLPGYSKAEDVMNCIDANQLSIIEMGTGTGKTVLVPKFALHCADYGSRGKVCVVLPKKIVTLSAAQYAAETLDVELGNEVGFVYKGSDKSKLNDSNKIIYMTDGTLIVQLMKDPKLSQYSTIIIDEAHERKIQIDMIMGLLKNLLHSGMRPDVKIIVMSATLDVPRYQKYFNFKNGHVKLGGALTHHIDVIFAKESCFPKKDYIKRGIEVLDEILRVTLHGDIIFFVTTSMEAMQVCRHINENYASDTYCVEMFAEMADEKKHYAKDATAYKELGNYNRKIVIATNVAESSITIDGLEYVIDSGFELQNVFDPKRISYNLDKSIITKSQAIQRRGRVGRTSKGTCYHLYTEDDFNKMDQYPIPNILKDDVTIDILKVMIIQPPSTRSWENTAQIMNNFIDAPNKECFKYSQEIFKTYNFIDDSNNLTLMGYRVAHFSSLEVNRSLFIIHAYQNHCAREACIIVSMMDAINSKMGNLFVFNATKDQHSMFLKELDSSGDHLTLLKLFNKFEEKDKDNVNSWCNQIGIKAGLLRQCKKNFHNLFSKVLEMMKLHAIPDRDHTIELQRHDNKPSFSEIKKRIITSLKESHKHLTATGLTTKFPSSAYRTKGNIGKESTLRMGGKKGDKTIIFDKLAIVQGKPEFSIVTVV